MKVFGLKIKSGNNKSLRDNLLSFDCKHAQELGEFYNTPDHVKDHIHCWFTFDSSHFWFVKIKEHALNALLEFTEYADDADRNYDSPCFHNPEGGWGYEDTDYEKINHEEVEVVELAVSFEKQNETDIPIQIFLNKESKSQNKINPLGYINSHFCFDDDFDPYTHDVDFDGDWPDLPTFEELVVLVEDNPNIFVGNYDESKIDPELIEKYEKTEVFIREVE